jgi:hypothetical protein
MAMRMRGGLTWAPALAIVMAVAVAGIAVAAKPTVVRAGNLVLKINGGFAPKKLPKQEPAPIRLFGSGNISTVDGSHPPVAKTITIDFDKQGAINARGLARCTTGRLQARPTGAAKSACRKAIVGKGSTTVRVAFPDSTPFNATGPLVFFNGGVRGGTTTVLIHAYVAVPTPTAIVTTVKVKRIRKGRYGTRAEASIPVIAGGSGAVTRFNLSIKRSFSRGGKPQGYLLARCGRGSLAAHGIGTFSDGTRLVGTIVRPCRAR